MSEQCPLFTPTQEEFSRPFVEYVSDIFRENPGLPMFKVKPPEGWKPRRAPYPDMSRITIRTPIRQHVFGKSGAYRCMLVEQKPITVTDYEEQVKAEAARLGGSKFDRQGGAQDGEEGEERSERAFWASITLNPPMYGADTPVSFFDDDVPFGWNFHNLGDLLCKEGVPEIPGVTTPMCYFGMWRSFFGWHKEDADLMSINYLHFGAPKVWYSVSPKHADKFDRMAQHLFPDLARECPAFVRHKDLLISPTQLHNFGIPFTTCKHNAGEFMVLNAAAYHAGFNTGFNCAEAINFATPDWVKVGKAANHCTCDAMKDAVRISMTLFDPNWVDPWAELETDESDDDDETDEYHSDHTAARHHQQHHGHASQQAFETTRVQLLSSWAQEQQARLQREAKQYKRALDASAAAYQPPPKRNNALGIRRFITPWHTAAELGSGADLSSGSGDEGRATPRPPPIRAALPPAQPPVSAQDPPAKAVAAPAPGTSAAAALLLRSAYAQLQQRKARSPASSPPQPTVLRPVPAPASKPVSAPAPRPVSAPAPRLVSAPAPRPVPAPAAKPVPAPAAKPVPAAAAPRPMLAVTSVAAMRSSMAAPQPAAAVAAPVALRRSSGGGATEAAGPTLITPIVRKDRSLPNDLRPLVAQPTPVPKPATVLPPAAAAAKVVTVPRPASVAGPRPASMAGPRPASMAGPRPVNTAPTGALGPRVMNPGGVGARMLSPSAANGGPGSGGMAGGRPVLDMPEQELLRELARDPVQGPPCAIVAEDRRGHRMFHLVQALKRPARAKDLVLLRLLREGPDGLFYPSGTIWEETKSTLIQVRTQQVSGGVTEAGKPTRLPAYKLLTLRSRILETDLLD